MAFLPATLGAACCIRRRLALPRNIGRAETDRLTDVISSVPVGRRDEMAPGDFVVLTVSSTAHLCAREKASSARAFRHVSVAHPTCPRLGEACLRTGSAEGIHDCMMAGTVIWPWRPRSFQRRGNRHMYRAAGLRRDRQDNMPEANSPARRALLCQRCHDSTDYGNQLAPRAWRCRYYRDSQDAWGQTRPMAKGLVARLPALLAGAIVAPCPQWL